MLDTESSDFLVPGFRRDDVWTPGFAGMTVWGTFNEAVNSDSYRFSFGYDTELNPLRLRLAFLNAGLAFPEVGTAAEKQLPILKALGIA